MPAGGQYSGIELFCSYSGAAPACTMTKAQIDALTVGSVVGVTGTFSSFLLSTAPAGAQPNLEIDAPVITATGQTMAPVAVDVPAATIAKAPARRRGGGAIQGCVRHVTGGALAVSSAMAAEFATTCSDKSAPVQMGNHVLRLRAHRRWSDPRGRARLLQQRDVLPAVHGCRDAVACDKPVAAQSFSSVSGIVEPEYSKTGSVYLPDLAHDRRRSGDLTHQVGLGDAALQAEATA